MNSSPQPPIQLSVSVVLYHSPPQLLKRLMHSLERSAAVAREADLLHTVSVRVVDNSCDPLYRQQIERLLADREQDEVLRVSYSAPGQNRGFGAGHNSALASQDSSFHLVLNPDAELYDDTLLLGLSAMQADDNIVLLSPRVWGGGGGQEFLCKRYPSVLALLLRGFAPGIVQRLFRRRLDDYEMRDLCSGDRPVDVVLASGCFMLLRTAALRAVGGFDDHYFLYFEDFDLSLRLARQGRLVFDPTMQIVHHGGYAASKGFAHVKYFIRAGITFFNRHGWRWI